MGHNRYFNTSFWKDNYVVDLDPTEKLLFNYLFTNAKATISGVYEIHPKEIGFDTGIDFVIAEKIVRRFEADGKLVYRDGWMVLANALKHQKLNPNIEIGIQKQYESIPDDIQSIVNEVWSKSVVASGFDWFKGERAEPVENSVEKVSEPKKPKEDLGPILIELSKLLGGTDKIKITEDRKKKLKVRMKTFTLDEIRLAAKIIGEDDFMQGKNDSKTKYATIDYLVRNDTIIARYLERGETPIRKNSSRTF